VFHWIREALLAPLEPGSVVIPSLHLRWWLAAAAAD